MMTMILAMMLNHAPAPVQSLDAPRAAYVVTYTSAARGVIRHADTASDHPERFTSSERTIAPTQKGKL